MTVNDNLKNTEVATYDSDNEGRQRVRTHYLLQPKRAESILQTTETVERWECDVSEYQTEIRKDVGRRRQDRCHTCIGTVASAEPLPEELCASQDDAV